MANRAGRRQFGWVRRCHLVATRRVTSVLMAYGDLAPKTYPNKTDAQNWLTLREADLLRGDWTDPELGRVELGPYGERWIAEHRLAERTRELYESLFRRSESRPCPRRGGS